ncbi:MARVEL domain-containing protein 3-like isoform X3 [Spea bombifrons]|uniref:MARVEL domain-containing protein 3-like isoform X3 n=1 Tax=Spea bombifrons TaxID=233779 RepID=UPI00234982FF|nr:MARVEL domain-containing protein 3-like isoform X3 [Spea bombifrons]
MSRSERSVQSERIPPSQRSSHDRSNREYSKNHGLPARDQDDYRERPRRERPERRSHTSNDRSLSNRPVHGQYARAPASSSEQQLGPSRASQHHGPPSQRTYTEKQSFSDKCSRLCSIRGMLQLVEIFLNLLVLICASSTQSASAGFSSIGGFANSYYYSMGYAMSGFQGDEVSQITQLDMEYSRMKMPTVYFAVGISLLLLSMTLSFLVANCMASVRRNKKVLLAEEVLNVMSALIYIICIGLYIHFIKQINGSELCKKRESLYNRHGYNSVSCEILGTEVAVCVFAAMLVVSYTASAVVVGLMFKNDAAKTSPLNSESLRMAGLTGMPVERGSLI